MECKLRSFNAYRAQKFGYELSAIDRLIMTRSFLHTHTEFQFSKRYRDVSFSATMADDAKCCRFKQIQYSHPERWDTIVIPFSDEQEDKAFEAAETVKGQPYDLWGLLSFLSKAKIVKPKDGAWWCSEVCAWLVGKFVELKEAPDGYHPTKLDSEARYIFSYNYPILENLTKSELNQNRKFLAETDKWLDEQAYKI